MLYLQLYYTTPLKIKVIEVNQRMSDLILLSFNLLYGKVSFDMKSLLLDKMESFIKTNKATGLKVANKVEILEGQF